MCAVLDVCVSGCRAWKRGGIPGRKRLTDEQMLAGMGTIHAVMRAASFEYTEVFYNRQRQHSTLGYQAPIQFPERRISEQNRGKPAAWEAPCGRRKTEGSSRNCSSENIVVRYISRDIEIQQLEKPHQVRSGGRFTDY
jgi:hypothetical protein